MQFVTSPPGRIPEGRSQIHIWSTGWDDWFQFSTLHHVVYVDRNGRPRDLGTTKIGQFGLQGAPASAQPAPGFRRPVLPERFTNLDTSFFSLGQDPEFYEALNNFGAEFRSEVLRALRDVAFDSELLDRAVNEDVMGVSLLRSVPLRTVRDQFARLAHGGARLTPFTYTYRYQPPDGPAAEVEFAVTPGALPPTNVHVVIGRNGVGKSTLLNTIATEIVRSSDTDTDPAGNNWRQFSNVVSVSFSAFDAFAPSTIRRNQTHGLPHEYIGLKQLPEPGGIDEDTPSAATKDLTALMKEMGGALQNCLMGARRARLSRALRLLEGDPIFANLGIGDLIDEADPAQIQQDLPPIFRRLSSGHQIVLLTITRLVEAVEEKSLVLMDEPEAHLHPPLLSAFIRALSDLLTDRNGMAIVATHSPVVLQEVPKSCVWMLHRNREVVSVNRPRFETFGENAGVLTDEVFGLEVTATGFHKMLADAAHASDGNYDLALARFNGQLGAEGRAILRAMTALGNGGPHVAR